MIKTITQKLTSGGRVSSADARWLWANAASDDLRGLAQIVRNRYHKPDHATYTIMRIINFTNICVAQCDYCAFYVLPSQPGGYILTRDEVFEKIDGLISLGGDLVGFNGGFNPTFPLEKYCELFRAVREHYGDSIEFYALTVAEFMYLAERAELDFDETARHLKEAGVHWITGGGAEILTEDFRARHSRYKYTVAEFFDAQRALLRNGLRTTATMVIGFDETFEERLEHLERCRQFQDETNGGLFSFLLWTYKPYDTALGGAEPSHEEYLRQVALSRIYLDNIPNIRASVLTQNENAFRALDFGANDFDIPIEDEVTQSAGATIDLDIEKLLGIPRSMGYDIQYRRTPRPPMPTPAGIS